MTHAADLSRIIADARRSNIKLRHAAPYLWPEWLAWQRARDELKRARAAERAARQAWKRTLQEHST